jgi:hypothetical protein
MIICFYVFFVFLYLYVIYMYMYVYIYILDPHMAPYGACEVAQSTARSNAQWCRPKKKHARVAQSTARSNAQWPRRKKKHARAVISSEQVASKRALEA